MNIIYRRDNGDIIDFIEGDVNGLNPLYTCHNYEAYSGDEDETNISQIPGFVADVLVEKRGLNARKINRWYSYDGTFATNTKISVAEIESAVPEESRVGQFFVKDNSGKCHIVFCDPNGEYRFEKLTKAT